MRDGRLEVSQRAACGAELAAVGDPRPEVMTVDGMELCWVPAGSFWLGREGEGPPEGERDMREAPREQVELPYGFWMGRYLVTVAQFREFLRDTGCRAGTPDSLSRRDNEPVAWVTWFEASNFCAWLSARWRISGWEVRLPSEAEWEKAARGGLEIPVEPVIRALADCHQPSEAPGLVANPLPLRRYPWGEEIDPNRVNYGEARIEARSAVGCFPSGASPYGCEEMAGNVWEWTRTVWGDGLETPWYHYPYRAEDGRENMDADWRVWRVLRGGAFDDDAARMRCAFRVRQPPDQRKSGIGFRVALFKGAV